MITPIEYYKNIIDIYVKAGEIERAEKQMKYMRNQFAYYGLKAAEWSAIVKNEFKKHGKYNGAELKEFVLLCYESEYREANYAGILMIEKVQKNEEADFIELLEYLITHNSWWDTVDWLAKLVGVHFMKYPELIPPITERWITDDNIWLNRSAIIFQLFYKEYTDFSRLCDYILMHKESKEFFIQKAMGWALRQYSRIDGKAVMKFVKAHDDLPRLTKKEALRLMM